ncbi:hypothetical protein ACED51_24080, partial [Photobacterium swingsii]|uniref:hypothetical protein n=1 Tax=Photobacterium swingsii TaxID=680026 RepID=UPI00352DA50B
LRVMSPTSYHAAPSRVRFLSKENKHVIAFEAAHYTRKIGGCNTSHKKTVFITPSDYFTIRY